jgi:hypothetical protein
MSIKQEAIQLAQNPKIASGVSALTTGTGVGTFLDWIPNDIGKLATLVGILLSVILIRVHLMSMKKTQLEVDILRQEKTERLDAARLRRASGQPARRTEDETG